MIKRLTLIHISSATNIYYAFRISCAFDCPELEDVTPFSPERPSAHIVCAYTRTLPRLTCIAQPMPALASPTCSMSPGWAITSAVISSKTCCPPVTLIGNTAPVAAKPAAADAAPHWPASTVPAAHCTTTEGSGRSGQGSEWVQWQFRATSRQPKSTCVALLVLF